ERLLLPWTASLPTPPQAPPENKNIPGDWSRGKELFYSQQVNCIACHTMRGEGGTLGPDPTNLIHKQADSVITDIIDPNASANPDYIAYRVSLKSGDILSGLVASEDATHLRITEGVGKSTLVNRSDVVSLAPTDVSIMPTGFKDLGQDKLDD